MNLFPCGYYPPLDVLPGLNPVLSSYYQYQISILRCMVELGRIYINTEVSMLESHLALPREGHLEVVLKIVSYLRGNHNFRLALDTPYPDIDHASFKKHKWVDLYGNVKEAITPNIPEPRVKDVDFRRYVNSKHSRNNPTRRLSTELLIYMNVDLIQWLSNKQPTIETLVFGVKFLAIKHRMETL